MSDPAAPDLTLQGKAVRTRCGVVGLTLEDVAMLVGVSARADFPVSRPANRSPATTPCSGCSAHSAPMPATRWSPCPAAARRRPHLRLGAVLTFLRSIPLGEASLVLDASIAGIRVAAAELTARLAGWACSSSRTARSRCLAWLSTPGGDGRADRRVPWRGLRRNRHSARRVGPPPAGGGRRSCPLLRRHRPAS